MTFKLPTITPMADPLEQIALQAAEKDFNLGKPVRLERLAGGRVNLSFKVTSPRGLFVLQRLHPVFGSGGAVAENTAEVTEALARAGLTTARVIPTVNGSSWAERQGVWRLMTWLPGGPGRREPGHIAEAARCLGLFHRVLADDPPSLKPLPPAEYNREAPSAASAWRELETDFSSHPRYARAVASIVMAQKISEGLPPVTAVTGATLHGDPKLENFLFDSGGRATALIDLDTVRTGWLLWELGDALRSWAGLRDENDQAHLDEPLFTAAVNSYRRHGLSMSSGEWESLPAAAALQVLNLARRYLRDFFEEAYFAWDRERYPSLPEQNLRRGAGLLTLAAELSERAESLCQAGQPRLHRP